MKELAVIAKATIQRAPKPQLDQLGISVTPVVSVSAAKNSVSTTWNKFLSAHFERRSVGLAQNVGKTTTKAEGSSEGETAAIGQPSLLT